MNRNIKKILKSGNPKAREVALVVSQFLKDIGLGEFSPKELLRISVREELTHNYLLARCHYCKRIGHRLNKKEAKPPKKIRNKYWIDYNWNLHKYSPSILTWEETDTPMYPGTRDILKDEDKTTSEAIAAKITKIDKAEKDNLTVEDLERIDKYIEEYPEGLNEIQGSKKFIDEIERSQKGSKEKQ